MIPDDFVRLPAGWYPDPTRRALREREREEAGGRDDTDVDDADVDDADVDAAYDDARAIAATLAYRPVSAAGHAGRTLPFSQATAARGPAPAQVTPPRPTPPRTPPPPSVDTGPAWAIAIVPLLHLVAHLLVVTGIGASQIPLVVPAIAAAVYLLVLGLAIADQGALRRSGHPLPASWAFALLGAPVYLIARGLRLGRMSGRGFGPLFVLAILGVLQLGSALAVPGLLISAAPIVFAAQAEQSVVADATAIDVRLDVVCPPIPPVLVGQQFSCAATTAAGDRYAVLVSLQRVNGRIDWRVDDWGTKALSR